MENLYDDSIGTDPRVHDYISMLQYDTGVIVKALQVRDVRSHAPFCGGEAVRRSKTWSVRYDDFVALDAT